MNAAWLRPDWPAPARVRALATTRAGGVSVGAYAGLNLGLHVGDVAASVAANRAILAAQLPAEVLWLNQVHGSQVVVAEAQPQPPGAAVDGDASIARSGARVLAIQHADCLPLLLCDRAGSVVGAAHAGWRGLALGVIEQTVAAMDVAPGELCAWLGVAIGASAYEVGGEVRAAFVSRDAQAARAFAALGGDHWRCDLYALARQRLVGVGISVERICGGGLCSFSDSAGFYSHRRDGVTGRMATLVWLAA